MNKHLAAFGAVVGLAVGGIAVASVSPLGVAGAQDPTPPAEAPEAGAGRGPRPDGPGPLDRALDALVEDGTLSQEQADAVRERTEAEREADREAHRERFAELRERFDAHRTELLEAAAGALGSTADEVAAALREGTSLAEQAEAAGVDRQAVVDALTPLFEQRIDEAVSAGKLTEERADAAREHVGKMVDRLVDGPGFGFGRGGPFGGGGWGGPGGPGRGWGGPGPAAPGD